MPPETESSINQNRSHDSLVATGEELLTTLRDLAADLKIRASALEHLDLDTAFDSELGLDSLTRVELIARIESHFKVRLGESAFANTSTPRELLRQILLARSHNQSAIQKQVHTLKLEQTHATPGYAETLLDVLDWHVQTHPDRPHIQFYQDGGDGETINFRQLQQRAENIALGLQACGLQPRQTVAIMLPTGADYFYTFFGILLAGGIPVPIYPPARLTQIEDHLIRHKNILNNCCAAILVTIPEALVVARLLKTHVASLQSVATPAKLKQHRGSPSKPKLSAADIAFLQYTSGSTGSPKGVTLSHANLLANIRAMGSKLKVNSGDIFVSWLPLYHDMGLIGAWFGSLYYSAMVVIMSPLEFLAKPERWLWAIHRYRGSLTAAPNFAYELCLKRTNMKQLGELRLDSVRAMFNGAEPVSPTTLARFSERFALLGLKASALMPVYGLAECTVGLSFPPLGRGPLIDRVARKQLMFNGIAKADTKSKNALRFVACGSPISGHEIRIVDESKRELPDRRQGWLQFRGPSATSGYYNNPEQTRDLFDGEWVNSGDLAYIADGEIYLTGRAKDLIIHAGRNLYPQELEEAVSDVPNVRKGCVVVFGSTDPASGTEKLIVLAETRETEKVPRQKIEVAINRAISDLSGTAPDRVILAPPQTVLKTSSGKLRRNDCKQLYERGLLNQPGRSVGRQFWSLFLSAVIPGLRRLRQSSAELIFAVYAWTVFGGLTAFVWPAVVVCPSYSARLKIIRSAARILRWLTRTEISIRGLESLSSMQQPCILVSNHCSYLDAPVLMLALPLQFSFVAKQELKQNFLTATFLDRIGTEYVTRFDTEKGVEDARKVASAAGSGKNLLFFPEGTFTRVPGLRPFFLGAFKTAVETGQPVVPIVIHGTRSILRSDSWFPRSGMIQIDILPPIDPDPVTATGDPWQAAAELRDETRRQFLANLREPDLTDA